MSKMEINIRTVVTAYHMLFLTMKYQGLRIPSRVEYEYTYKSLSDFHLLSNAILFTPYDCVGIADELARIINGYKEKVLPELSDMSPDVEYYAQNVLHCMRRMHRDCLDQLSK